MKIRVGGLVAAALAMLALGAGGAGAKATKCGTVTLNEQAWAGSTANTYVVKNVLEKSLGCKVNITKIAEVPVRHYARGSGKSKYGLERVLKVLADLITVKFLHSYLTRPMHVLGLAGLVSMGMGVVSLLATVWMKSHYGLYMTGNPLLLLSVVNT